MNVAGLFLLFFILIGASVGIFLIAGKANTTPVDSYGDTVSNETNLTAENTTTIIRTGAVTIPWAAVVVVVILIVGVFLWAIGQARGGGGYNKSRYY